MYEDYPTIYETSINQIMIYYIIFAFVALFILVFILVSLVKIYRKANRSGISALIPIYNIFVLLEIVNLPKWYFILLLIPGFNLIIYVKIVLLLVKFFRKSTLFGIGLILLPFIFYPILAFDGSEYIGINIDAIEGKTIVAEEHKIISEDTTMINEELDKKSQKLNISIGGGVYQQDYTKGLLKVDDEKTIQNNSFDGNEVEKKVGTTFITPKAEELSPEHKSLDNSIGLQSQLLQIHPISELDAGKSIIETPINNNLTNIENNMTQDFNSNRPDEKSNTSNQISKCPKCGMQVSTNSKTCFLCGTLLK